MIVILKEELNASGLVPGKNYFVLSILIKDNSKSEVRVISDDGTPALYKIELFEITDNMIGDGFGVYHREDGAWEICPKSMSEPRFWVNFFDGDAESEMAYVEFLEVYLR